MSEEREAELAAVTVGPLEFLDGPVRLDDYDARWPDWFAREEERIRLALGDRVLRLEHVGSTSVPGLVAKPRIDILLVVAAPADEAELRPGAASRRLHAAHPRAALARAPDVQRPGHGGEPPRVSVRTPRRSSACCASATACASRSADRDRYAAAKRELAARHWRHLQDYADAKSAVVEAILRRG